MALWFRAPTTFGGPRDRGRPGRALATCLLALAPLCACPFAWADTESATLGELLKQGADFARAENWKESLAAYRKALTINPNYPDTHYGLANAYAGLQQMPEAIHEYRETLRLKPDFPGVHTDLGSLYESQGELPQAIEEYRAEVRIRPADASAHSSLAVALAAGRQFDEAAQEFRRALDLKPRDPQIVAAFAGALQQAGDTAGAIK